MPQFKPEKISNLISEVRKAATRLNHLGSIDKNKFLNDEDKIDSAKYNFIVAIESAIDICNHIISQNGFRIPENYGILFKFCLSRESSLKNLLQI